MYIFGYTYVLFCMFVCVFFVFLRPHLQHINVPRLSAQLELQLSAYGTATPMPDLSQFCNICHSLWQCRNLNPLSRARDQTCILMDTFQVLNLLSYNGKYLHMCSRNIFFPFSFFLATSAACITFLGQESNLCHRSNPSSCTDNTESLTQKKMPALPAFR